MFKKALIAACAAASAAAPYAAIANDDPADKRWYLSGQYNFYNADSNRHADGDAVGLAVAVGKHFSNSLAVEVTTFSTDLNSDTVGANSTELTGYSVNALFYPLGREYGLYTLAGAGVQTTEIQGLADNDNQIVDLGIGFMRSIGSGGTQLRGEIRARLDEHDDKQGLYGGANSSTDYIASFGFLKPFGENQGSSYDFPSYDGEFDKRIYANIGGSYTLTDHSHNVDNDGGIGYKFGLGIFLRRTLSVEFHADLSEFDIAGGGTQEHTNYGIDLLAYKTRNPEFAPYTVIGTGVTEIDLAGTNTDGNYVDLGFGFLTQLTGYGLGIRFDARYRTEFLSNTSRNTHNGIVNLGLNVPFGSPPSPPDDDNDGVANADDNCSNTPANTPVDSQGCPLDSDNDGVIDAQDACPNTAAGTEVDARGCKIDKDSDGDGVNDSKDECPGTVEGVAVGANGCPVDDDGDGVINSADQCPETPAGLEVDGNGCVVGQSAILKGVNFEFNSATLTPHSRRILDDVAGVWAAQADLSAQISGHTDWMGPSDFNLQLSQQRADAVKAYLTQNGVPGDKLSARGFGESRPISDNNTELGRAENRRVELEVK